MRRNLLRILVVACTSGWACGSMTAPSAPVDRQIVLAPGQTINISEAAVSIRFEGVQEDSRCPGDATCVWAGDAVVGLEVDGRGVRAAHQLHTYEKRGVRHESLTITLMELSPYPFVSRPIQPGDYRATIRVVR
jgi:hypothetical protein